MSTGIALAVDIGGTKIAAGLVDRGGRVLTTAEEPTPVGDGAERVADVLATVVARVDQPGARFGAVGVSCAGPVDVGAGTVSPVNIGDWWDFPLAKRMSALTELPVSLACDGVAITAAEHAFGAARGHPDAVCLVVSTGVGGGLVLGGQVYAGPSGNAGHLGHIVVDLDGERCSCGARGCVETMASGPALVRWAMRHGWVAPDGRPPTGADVAAAACSGDAIATAAFDRAGQALAAAVAASAALVDVRVAVIGGGVAQAGEVLFAPVRRHLEHYARLSFVRGVRVVPAALGRYACLVGAAHLAFERDDRNDRDERIEDDYRRQDTTEGIDTSWPQ